MKSATELAIEAIEASEIMFADEIGAVLEISPAVKVALISTLAAAIQAAIAEDRKAACACRCPRFDGATGRSWATGNP
jgi:hypothetical protein